MFDGNFLNGKLPISYVINFGNKDKDIWKWAVSVPKRRFSSIIKDIIRVYNDHDDSYMLPLFNEDVEVTKPFRKSFSLGLLDHDVYKIILQYDEQLISYKIKEIIRHCYFRNNNLREEINNSEKAKNTEEKSIKLECQKIIVKETPNIEKDIKIDKIYIEHSKDLNDKYEQKVMIEIQVSKDRLSIQLKF